MTAASMHKLRRAMCVFRFSTGQFEFAVKLHISIMAHLRSINSKKPKS